VNHSLQKQFGKRVRDARKALGWSQEEFADKCGLDRTYISGIERGIRNPTLQIIGVISDALDLSLSQFFSGI